MDFSRPGKPSDNPYIESFNGSFQDECLNLHWFLSLADAQEKIEHLQVDFVAASQVTLRAGHRYALELQGEAKSAPLFWRVSRQDTYTAGSAYQNRQLVLLNNKRVYDFALAVYGTPLAN